MFCPHCNNKIPDGSNICPLCYANLAGVKPQKAAPAPDQDGEKPQKAAPARKSTKKAAYTQGSRGSKKSADRTPMIIAIGLILILIVIIAMIIRSMFGAGGTPAKPVVTAAPQNNVNSENFVVFGATPVPTARPVITPTPYIEITPTPAPTPEPKYDPLRKGDEGPEVVTLQQALAELGYLNGAADGNFGTGTQTAVKNFQKDNGLDADGIAGRMTLEALFAKSSVTPIPETTVGPGDIMDLPG
ncbi:MAG: peptidoglycan-binding domain-containing protein [Eubacteriales bacterium]|nr:peptidoglycan-binding domain-containing protein [Eubacteriales bacterium]